MLKRPDHLENFVKSLAANPKQFPDFGSRLGEITFSDALTPAWQAVARGGLPFAPFFPFLGKHPFISAAQHGAYPAHPTSGLGFPRLSTGGTRIAIVSTCHYSRITSCSFVYSPRDGI